MSSAIRSFAIVSIEKFTPGVEFCQTGIAKFRILRQLIKNNFENIEGNGPDKALVFRHCAVDKLGF